MSESLASFRALDVVFCVRDKVITRLGLDDFLAFLFFFPTISAGPIDRYRRFLGDWNESRTRREFLLDLDGAIRRVFRGFLYKFIIAALIKRYWLDHAEEGVGFGAIVSYMYAYSLYLFFDFAGYSAFAIALSYLFGVHTPENFNRPFFRLIFATFGIAGISLFPFGFAIMFTCALCWLRRAANGSLGRTPPGFLVTFWRSV